MKAATAIGIVIAIVGILGSAMMEGTAPTAFINIPAIMIVFAGTFGVTMGACGMDKMKAIPGLYKRCFSAEPQDLGGSVQTMVAYAERARRDGLLALEDELPSLDDEFTRKGLQLVVDGTDPDLVREILEADIDAMSARHKSSAGVFEKAGGFAPTMGIIGTVMGLVNVLSHLDKPDELGKSIATAFIATLYGVLSANVFWLPVGERLKQRNKEEVGRRTLAVEGVLSVQAGDNPRVVREKLEAFLPMSERGEEGATEEAAAAGEAPAQAAAA
jgi:chemotaxis protein MotA